MAKQAVDQSTKEMILDEEWELYEDTAKEIKKLWTKIEELKRLRNYLVHEMHELKAQGINYAGTTYKNGKYLYLVYPDKNGSGRKREYIGQDEKKIKAALDALSRGETYSKKEGEKRRIEGKMYSILQSVQYM